MESKNNVSHQSSIDPTRETVGAIYRAASISNTEDFVLNGDLTNSLVKSLVDDLNETLSSDPYEGRSFYVTIHEKKDLQMPRAIDRKLITTKYRPYPEDDTIVFHVEPRSNNIKFCWCLPHHTEMDNMLANSLIYDAEMINDIRAWKRVDLEHFGFKKVPVSDNRDQLVPMEKNRDKPMNFSESTFSFS